VRGEAAAFLDLCADGDWMAIAKRIDEMVEWKDLDRYEKFFGAIMELVRDAFLRELPAGGDVFSSGPVWRAKKTPSPAAVEKVLDLCGRSIVAVRGYANILLVLAGGAIELAEVIGAKKQ